MRKLLLTASASFACAFFSFAPNALAETTTLKLNNGEVLIGEVLSRDDDTVVIKNSYAEIKLPAYMIVAETIENELDPDAELVVEMNDEIESENQSHLTAPIVSQEEWHPFFGSEKSVIGKNDPVYNYIKEIRGDYTEFMENLMPENLDINLRAGITSETTTYKKDSYYFAFTAEKKWETMSFKTNGFYNYEWQKSNLGVESVTTDKYGLSGEYRWNFLENDDNWYFVSVASYRHDTIKMINLQIDESIGIGYEFKFPTIGLKWAVSVGPGARYLDATDFDRHVIPMAFLNENMSWDLTDLLRVEHVGYFGVDLETGTSATAYVMIGLVFAPEEVMSLAFRLTNDYDTINSPNAIRNEQKFILSLEIPIKGKTTKTKDTLP